MTELTGVIAGGLEAAKESASAEIASLRRNKHLCLLISATCISIGLIYQVKKYRAE